MPSTLRTKINVKNASTISASIIALNMALLHPAAAQSVQAQGANTPDDQIIIVSAHRRASTDPIAALTGLEKAADLTQSLAGGGLAEALQALPDVRASHFGPQASRPIIRGLGDERVRLMMDAMAGLDASSVSADHAPALDGLEAQQVEVVRSAAALRFGANAIGGAINVVTGRLMESHNGPDGQQLDIAFGSDSASNGTAQSFIWQGNQNGLALRLDGSVRDSGNVSVPGFLYSADARAAALKNGDAAEIARANGRDTIENSGGHMVIFGAGVARDFGPFHLAISHRNLDQNYGIPANPEGNITIDLNQSRQDVALGWNVDNQFLDQLSLRLTQSDYRHDEVEEDGTLGTRFVNKGIDGRLEAAIARHDVGGVKLSGLAGLTHTDSDFATFGAEAFVPPSTRQENGMFWIEHVDIGAAHIEIGARADDVTSSAEMASGHVSHQFSLQNYALSFSMPLSESFHGQFSLSHGERAPSSTELYADGVHAATASYEVGSQNLDTESANGAEANLIWQYGGYQITASIWANNFNGFIGFAPTGNDFIDPANPTEALPIFQVVQADARLHGVEFTAKGPITYVGDTKISFDSAFDLTQGRFIGAGNLPLMPAPFGRLGIVAEQGPFHGSLTYNHLGAQNRITAEETPTEGASWYDAEAAYDVLGAGGLQLVASISNLNNAEIRDSTSRLKDVLPRAGRSGRLGLRAHF